MSLPDALVSVALLGFLGFTLWLACRPTSTHSDDQHVKDLRKLLAELAALREQVDRLADGTNEARESHTTTRRT